MGTEGAWKEGGATRPTDVGSPPHCSTVSKDFYGQVTHVNRTMFDISAVSFRLRVQLRDVVL